MRSTARSRSRLAPDGKSVYVASGYDDAVARFNRNTTTGAIAQPAGAAGCVSQTGAGPCADGHGLVGPVSVVVAPDGKSVYVASHSSHAVARLNRNPTTGAIAQPAGAAGCVSQTGAGPCADGHALLYPQLGGGEPGREERVHHLGQRRRGALQSGPLEPFRANQRMLTAAEAPTAARTIE